MTLSPVWLIVLSCLPAATMDRTLPVARPETVGVSPERLGRIDGAVAEALARRDVPGAVVLVLHDGRVIWRKAYGVRSRQPTTVPLNADTVFDLASLTKPIATATSILLLIEKGKLRLSDQAAQYIPGFARLGKEKITVEHLLLHTSGLIADNSLADYRDGPAQALERIHALGTVATPGERSIYSDVGYIVLGELVQRVSGQSLDAFARQHIFAPLGMSDTTFCPTGDSKQRAAPTEQHQGRWLTGEVHDPRARALGGVAGHAGLFSTADDLAIYAQMLLDNGMFRGQRILAPLTVRLMTTPRLVPRGLRSYGWDVQTGYSSQRGSLFPAGQGFGHTGFTGTSLWIDPASRTAVILLTSRLYGDSKGEVSRLRSQVATLAAAALPDFRPPDHPYGEVLTGLDVLVREKFARLRGRRVGLATNHTGRDREGRSAIDLFHQAGFRKGSDPLKKGVGPLSETEGLTLVALFSPEHGIRGAVEAHIPDSVDQKTGLPIYSLYGQRRRPTAEMLKGIDTLVFDIQDAGCRFYTYISTLGYLLEAASEHKLKVMVLDRPNPLGGLVLEGPVRDPGRESFTAYHALPARHGMTVGELARLFRAERQLTCSLEVVALEGWRRGDMYDHTGLEWVSPSPNLRSLTEALLYPGIGLLETTNVSVGRGTDRPFEWIGAPWIEGRRLATALAELHLPGLRVVPLQMTPAASTHKGSTCGGVQFIVDDWKRFQPVRTGLAVALTLRRLYPDQWQIERYDALLCHRKTWEGIKAGTTWTELARSWEAELNDFIPRRRPHLLYPE
jgi:uncharacterized protein YbbC (DUF1343 family)/CubicO group peptidase (beta-lactamase class C family)